MAPARLRRAQLAPSALRLRCHGSPCRPAYAVRLLRKTPVFTVAAIGTLALGIGANTTIFSLVQTMLLRPLPYQNPDQVVMVWEDRTAAGFPRNTPAPGNYRDWRG